MASALSAQYFGYLCLSLSYQESLFSYSPHQIVYRMLRSFRKWLYYGPIGIVLGLSPYNEPTDVFNHADAIQRQREYKFSTSTDSSAMIYQCSTLQKIPAKIFSVHQNPSPLSRMPFILQPTVWINKPSGVFHHTKFSTINLLTIYLNVEYFVCVYVRTCVSVEWFAILPVLFYRSENSFKM